jgi:hypothetical protein
VGDPRALHLIVGKSHSELVRRDGEAYRRHSGNWWSTGDSTSTSTFSTNI